MDSSTAVDSSPVPPERRGLGGSDVAAALGLHPHKPPIVLWQELRGELVSAGNRYTDWGTAVEPALLADYERRHGVEVGRRNVTVYHRDHDWQRATPDGIVAGPRGAWGVEAKHTRRPERWGEPGTDQVPTEHWVQCQWYMHVTGLTRWTIVAAIAGDPPEDYELVRDDEVIGDLVERAGAWWQRHVVEGQEPEVDGSDGCRAYINHRHPWSREDYVQASDELEVVVAELRRVRGSIRDLERQRDLLENHVCAAIGERSGLESVLGRITWRPRAGAIAWKAVAMHLHARLVEQVPEELPELTLDAVAAFFRGAPSRPLLMPRSWSVQ